MDYNDVIRDYDIIIMMLELVIPTMIPFPTTIYKPVLVPFIPTWSLRDMCVCLSVCLSVRAISFEEVDIETSCLVRYHILIISRSSFSINFKVNLYKMLILLPGHQFNLI